MTGLLIFFALVIIASLAFYAWRLTQAVKEKEREQAAIEQERQQKQQEQKAYLAESIRVIASNVITEDLNLSEAVIRSKMLMDGLLLQPDERQPYDILEVVYQRIKDFDTHQARKALSSLERQAQDVEREEIEEKYREQLIACFTKLQKFELQRH